MSDIEKILKGKVIFGDSKRLKLFMFGGAGVGKTYTSLCFPKPFVIDTELRNQKYSKKLEAQGGVLYQTEDYEEVFNVVRTLSSSKHDFQTLVIDSATLVYQRVVNDMERKKSARAKPNEEYQMANHWFRKFVHLLRRLDMHVVLTAEAKDIFSLDTEERRNKIEELNKDYVTGKTFDTFKKLDHMCDLTFEVKFSGSKRVGILRKFIDCREPKINDYPRDIELNYENIVNLADRLELIDKGEMIKEFKPLNLVLPVTVKKLKELIEEKRPKEGTVWSWISRAKINNTGKTYQECLDELTEPQAMACIEWLEKQAIEAQPLMIIVK